MPRELDEPRAPSTPVVKRTAIGQHFIGAIVRVDQRPVKKQKDGVLHVVAKDGHLIPEGQQRASDKLKQELVVTALALPGTTAPAGIGDTVAVPEPGAVVRLILRGQSFAQWIEARKTHKKLSTCDIIAQTTTEAQAYDANGAPDGPKLTTQAQVDAVPRQKAVGIYGPLTLRIPSAAELAQWDTKVDAAADAAAQANRTPLAETGIEEEPF